MIALIFVSFGIFIYGLIMQYPENQTQRQMDLAFMTTMFGMVSMIILAFVVTVGGYK